MDHIIVYDTESASLKVEDGLVEHAYLEIDDDGTVLGEFRSLIKPPGLISAGASGVHGIVASDVIGAPSLDEYWESTGNIFKGKKVCMIAHNAQFDAKYLEPYVGELHTLCTLKLARIAFPNDIEGQPQGYIPPDNHKLPTLMFYLGLARKGTHNALDDVYTCLQLLEKISDKLDLNLEELFELSNKKIIVDGDTKITFGTHIGTKLKDLSASYVKWLISKADNLDPDIKAFLKSH